MMLKGCAFLLCPGEVRVCFVILAAFEPIAAINAGEGAGAASDDRGWDVGVIPGQNGLLFCKFIFLFFYVLISGVELARGFYYHGG